MTSIGKMRILKNALFCWNYFAREMFPVYCWQYCPAEVQRQMNWEMQPITAWLITLYITFPILWIWKGDTIRSDAGACFMFPFLCFCFPESWEEWGQGARPDTDNVTKSLVVITLYTLHHKWPLLQRRKSITWVNTLPSLFLFKGKCQ